MVELKATVVTYLALIHEKKLFLFSEEAALLLTLVLKEIIHLDPK